MEETVVDAVNEYLSEDKPRPPTVYLHPKSHHEWQHETEHSIDDYFPDIEITTDEYIEEGEVVVLPEDVIDFAIDDRFQASPTKHHLRQVVDDPVMEEGRNPRESVISSSVQMEVEKVNWVIDIEYARHEACNVETIFGLDYSEVDDNTELDVGTLEVTDTAVEVTVDHDDTVSEIPIEFVGLGDVDNEQALDVITDKVRETIDSTITSPIIGTDENDEKVKAGEKHVEVSSVYMDV